MSNLHKDLSNDQIHNPKDFSTAANDTKLTKNSSGNLEWVADAGGGGVSQIIAGSNVTISPTGGTGAVTINSPISIVSSNIEGHGNISAGNEFGLGNAQYNNEHKFSVNLGASPITWVSPKNMVNSSVWVVPRDGARMLSFNGWIYGVGQVHLSLLRTKLACPLVGEYPSQLPICRLSTELLTLTGNNTPICFNITDFATCGGFDEEMGANEVLMLSAYVPPASREAVTFNLNCNIAMTY